jgi:hypothetical protein
MSDDRRSASDDKTEAPSSGEDTREHRTRAHRSARFTKEPPPAESSPEASPEPAIEWPQRAEQSDAPEANATGLKLEEQDRGATEPDSSEKPLREHYRECANAAVQFSIGGTGFMDRVFPFIERVIEIDETNHGQRPARLNEEGRELFSGKFKWKDTQPQHISLILKHLMAEGGIEVRQVNTGVVSRFTTVIWATLVDPHPKLDENGIPILPSTNIKAHKGTNKLLSAWRELRPKKDRDDIVNRESRIPESVAEEREAEAHRDGLLQGLRRAADKIKDASWVKDAAILGEIDISKLHQTLRPSERVLISGERIGDKLVLREVLVREEELERLAEQ